MPRHSLSEAALDLIQPLLPEERPPRKGRPWSSHRMILHAIVWILTAGTPWRDLPKEFGPWKTVYNRFRRWKLDRTWDRILETLQQAADEQGLMDHELWCVDGTVVRAHKAAAGAAPSREPDEPEDHALGRSRGGFSTKIHLLCDGNGVPLGVQLTPGQQNECTQFDNLLASHPFESFSVRRPKSVAGDKGYHSNVIRQSLAEAQIEDVIPTYKNQEQNPAFDKEKYRKRNIVERLIGWLKENRKISTRYEKKASHFLAMIKIAMIKQMLKLHLRDTP
jgi:transposase